MANKIWVWKNQYHFFCPGCETTHAINDTWEFNHDLDRPTIQPSILSTGIKRCHSYITDGRIEFLGDSDHDLAGQTVDLPDWPEKLSS